MVVGRITVRIILLRDARVKWTSTRTCRDPYYHGYSDGGDAEPRMAECHGSFPPLRAKGEGLTWSA